jgi:hypothetical protein
LSESVSVESEDALLPFIFETRSGLSGSAETLSD